MKTKRIPQEAGKCPKCHKLTLEYPQGSEPVDDQVYYSCDCSACGWTGKEWYTLEFAGFTDNEGNDIKD
jgi:predicted nucleic-acid-binding Zn-ribbon protein